jgi:hypothetical protein
MPDVGFPRGCEPVRMGTADHDGMGAARRGGDNVGSLAGKCRRSGGY